MERGKKLSNLHKSEKMRKLTTSDGLKTKSKLGDRL